jgi:hypothetical protein
VAILHADGFETGLIDSHWAQSSDPEISSSYGRLGGIGARVGDANAASFRKTITLTDDYYALSFAVYVDILAGGRIINNPFVTNSHFHMNGNELYLTDPTGDLTSSTGGSFGIQAWHWVELEKYFHASTGHIKAWLNGSLVINETGLNTGARPSTITSQFGGSSTSDTDLQWIDDVIISDGSGSYNTTRPIGDSQIIALFPSDNGNTSGLTGSDANQTDNYLLVDENPEPATADYCASSTEGDKDTYAMDDLASTAGTILALLPEFYAQKDDSGSKFARNVLRTNSIDYVESSVGLATSWSLHQDIVEENPDTTSAWTPTEVNALEAGFEVRDS